MRFPRYLALMMSHVVTGIALPAVAEPPQVHVAGVRLQLAAEQPDIVTPIGMAFDAQGRLLVVESNTHFPPDNYPGPQTDRIRRLEDADGDGRFDHFGVYYEGSRHTMCVEAHPNGWIYVTTRAKMFRLRGEDAQGRAAEEESLVELQTAGDYPHNGLSGLAVDSQGRVYFGLGENLGEPYALVGSDGLTLRGGGEGGNIYRIEPDGRGLTRIATGFWNPFGLGIDPSDRLFAVDNDPDSRPPCRLLHVVPGGDYGYQFRYGRSGLHPLQAWDGELPGTLPMAAGTGEAPSDVLLFRGRLWVTSWGHHRIERYALTPSGASWRGAQQTVVSGDAMFRPVCLAEAPDGSLCFSDWVDRSYNVHRQGRIWRLSFADDGLLRDQHPPLTAAEQRAAALRQSPNLEALGDTDPFIQQAAVWGFRNSGRPPATDWNALNARQRVAWLQMLRWGGGVADDVLQAATQDASSDVRLMAVRIISDNRMASWRERLESMLGQSIDQPALFRGIAAALDYLSLSGEAVDGAALQRQQQQVQDLLWAAVQDRHRALAIRAAGARMLAPGDVQAALAKLPGLLQQDNELTTCLLWQLVQINTIESRALLEAAALNAQLSDACRAIAVIGLAADGEAHRPALVQLAQQEAPATASEARRALHQATEPSPRPSNQDLDGWMQLVGKGGDAAAGERRFFDPQGPGCARCHRHQQRGADVGPALTDIARQWDRRRLLQALLDPSRDIAPRYRTEMLRLQDGRVLSGYVAEHYNAAELVDGDRVELLQVFDTQGRMTEVKAQDILERVASPLSIMPVDLINRLSVQDVQDLLAFLEQLAPETYVDSPGTPR